MTAYPTSANPHPLLKHKDGVAEWCLPQVVNAGEFPSNPGRCVKLIIRNVQVSHQGSSEVPSVICCQGQAADSNADMLWCALPVEELWDLNPSNREEYSRAHPGDLAQVLGVGEKEVTCLTDILLQHNLELNCCIQMMHVEVAAVAPAPA